jgi:hypothetical protein
MHPSHTLLGTAGRIAAISFLAATAAFAQAGSRASTSQTPLWLTSESLPANPAPALLSSNSSSSASPSNPDSSIDLTAAALDSSQPPPRRYDRPSFSDKNSNPDGSPKYTFFGGAGMALPIGNTHTYQTPSYSFQLGGGRNFNQNLGLLLQFDYDHFGLQAATIANQTYIYNYGCPAGTVAAGTCGISGLDGNNHIWSFTLNPAFTLATRGSLGAYAVVGAGFYHKVTNFLVPTSQEECSIYGCGYFNVDETVDHYTSNAVGVNGGFGLTVKLAKFSTAKLYIEARYVLLLNSQRTGYTAQNVATTTYAGYDAYPANSNRTTYIPIKIGIRF